MTTDVTERATMRTTSSTQITVFWARNAEVRYSAALGSLYIDAAGMAGGHSMTLMFSKETPVTDQVTIAERVLAGVQRWRDGLVEHAEGEQTARDELVSARAEIARLKAERDGGDDA